jgi:hypothetical protein
LESSFKGTKPEGGCSQSAFPYQTIHKKKGEVNMKYEAPMATVVNFKDAVSAWRFEGIDGDVTDPEEASRLSNMGYNMLESWGQG